MNRTLALLPLGSLAFASLALGCGGDEAKRTSLTLTLRGPNDNHSAEIYGFPQETLSVIDAVRVTAMRGNEVIEQVEFDYEAYEGRLPTVPYGDDNWITVEALANDDVVASGASPRFSLAPGDAPLSLEVFTAVPREFTGTFKFDSELDQSVPSTYELPGGRAGAAVATLPDGRVVVIGGAELALGEGVDAHDARLRCRERRRRRLCCPTAAGGGLRSGGVDRLRSRRLQRGPLRRRPGWGQHRAQREPERRLHHRQH